MSFNEQKSTGYEYEADGIRYKGSLPKSALEQFDLYTAMLAYWEAKTPQTWGVLRGYILANSEAVEVKTGIKLSPETDLNFFQVKILIDRFMNMAADFFTSPQAAEKAPVK